MSYGGNAKANDNNKMQQTLGSITKFIFVKERILFTRTSRRPPPIKNLYFLFFLYVMLHCLLQSCFSIVDFWLDIRLARFTRKKMLWKNNLGRIRTKLGATKMFLKKLKICIVLNNLLKNRVNFS